MSNAEHQEDQPTNVIALHPPAPRRDPPLTPAELAEYRRLRPLLLQMLEEWHRVRMACPIAQRAIR